MELQMTEFSIVIPLYNKGQHIERAIRSVLAQTIQDFEIIIVNDGSTDDGPQLIQSIHDPRIRLIHQENQGVSVARNRGIREAKSDFILFLDADDAHKPDFLETISKLKQNFPDAGIYCTAYEYVEPSGRTWIPRFLGVPPAPWEGIIPDYYYSSLGEPIVWTSAVGVPKEIFSVVGFFTVGEKLGQDIDLWLRIALKYPIAFSYKVGATYFRDAANRSCTFDSGVIWPKRAVKTTALKALRERAVTGKSAEYLKEYVYRNDLEVAALLLWAGRKKEALGLLRECRTKTFLVKKLFLYLCLLVPRKAVLFIFELKNKVLRLK